MSAALWAPDTDSACLHQCLFILAIAQSGCQLHGPSIWDDGARLLDKATLFQWVVVVLFWARGKKKMKMSIPNGAVDGKTENCIYIEILNISLFRSLMPVRGQQKWQEWMPTRGLIVARFSQNKLHPLNFFYLLLTSADCDLVLTLFFATCANMQARQTPCGDFCKLKRPESSIIPRFLVD